MVMASEKYHRRLETDLQDTPTVSFSAMVKALLLRARDLDLVGAEDELRKGRNVKRHHARSMDDLSKFANEQYRTFLDSATRFCNSKMPQAKKLKESLRQAYVIWFRA